MCGSPTNGKPGTLQQRCIFLCRRSPSERASFLLIVKSFVSATWGNGRPWSPRLYAEPALTPSTSRVAWSPGQPQDYRSSTTWGERAPSSEPDAFGHDTQSGARPDQADLFGLQRSATSPLKRQTSPEPSDPLSGTVTYLESSRTTK